MTLVSSKTKTFPKRITYFSLQLLSVDLLSIFMSQIMIVTALFGDHRYYSIVSFAKTKLQK